jgi:signal peptidase II
MKSMVIFCLTALGVFVLDRITKMLAVAGLSFGANVTVVPGVLEWRLTSNSGIALGLLSGNAIAAMVLPVLVALAGWLVFRRYRFTRFTYAATALVVGGFLSNLLDRLLLGYVLDMVYFPWMPWYICNLADIAICVGVAMLIVSLIARPRDWVRKTEADMHEENSADGPA